MRHIFHVAPFGSGWRVLAEGGPESIVRDTKAEAITTAKQLATAAGLGQVIAHGSDGRIEEKWTYGNEPPDVPG